VVELPRLRLPLPERTGSDRDELRCPHGFVDRAYSVFLLRCVSANLTHLLQLRRPTRCASIPPFLNPLVASPYVRAARLRGVNRGYEPPGAGSARFESCLPGRRPDFLRWRSGRPRADGGARPARDASELLRSHSPSKISCHRRPASRSARDPYPARTHCSLHASLDGVRKAKPCVRPSRWAVMTWKRHAKRTSSLCVGTGEASCHRFAVTTRTGGSSPITCAAARSAVSPPG